MWHLVGIAVIAYGVYWTTGPVVTETDMWLRYYAPYLRLLEFATGVVAADIVMARRDKGRRLSSDLALVLAIAFTAFLFTTPLGRLTIINYLIAPMIAVSLIVGADPRSMASRVLSARWLLWIGDRSYSIYLLQALYLILAPMLALSFGYLIEPTRIFTWSSFIGGLISSTATIALVLILSDLS